MYATHDKLDRDEAREGGYSIENTLVIMYVACFDGNSSSSRGALAEARRLKRTTINTHQPI